MEQPGHALEVPGGGPVDHVVLGVPDLDAGIEHLAERTGVRARPASAYTAASSGTRSSGVRLGGERFLEIYGPNPGYDGPADPMHGVLTALPGPQLLTWMVRVADLDATARALADEGWPVQRFQDIARTDAASYRNGHIASELFNPSVPFLIEWRDRLDMDERMPAGCELLELWVTSPDPDRTRAIHELLGISVRIEAGAEAAASLALRTPTGTVVL